MFWWETNETVSRMLCPRFTSRLFHVVSCLPYRLFFLSLSFLPSQRTYTSTISLFLLPFSLLSTSLRLRVSPYSLFLFVSTLLLDSSRLIASSLLCIRFCLRSLLFLCAVLFLPPMSPPPPPPSFFLSWF